MASLTRGNRTRCTHPCRSPTRPRRCPLAGVSSGSRRAGQSATRGATRSSAASRGKRSSSPKRRTRVCRPAACATASGVTRARRRPGWVKTSKSSLRRSRSVTGRRKLRSTWGRVASMSWSYRTPDGQAVTQAMQPRQASKWATISPDIALRSSRPAPISTILPRGESISSFHNR